MRWSLLLLLIWGLFSFSSISAASETREWRSGRHTVSAKFVRFEDDKVVLFSETKQKEYKILISKLSPQDQEHLRHLRIDLGEKEKAAEENANPLGPNSDQAGEDEETTADEEESSSGDSSEWDGPIPAAEEEPELDPNKMLFLGDTGLVLPTDPAQWLNTKVPLTNGAIGNKGLVFVFFDEAIRRKYPRIWPAWLKAAEKFKGKPVLFIAVVSGEERSAVQATIQSYSIPWPTIADTDRTFERHCNLSGIDVVYPYAFRVVDGNGEFATQRGVYELTAVGKRASLGAKWRVNPKGLPKNLKTAWKHIEYGRFKEAAADVSKAANSKKSTTRRAGEKLDKPIAEHINKLINDARRNERDGEKFAAYRIFSGLVEDFKRYHLDERVAKSAKRLAKDPDLVEEIEAWKEYLAAKKLTARSSGRRRAIIKLEKVIDAYPDSAAAAEAETLIGKLDK